MTHRTKSQAIRVNPVHSVIRVVFALACLIAVLFLASRLHAATGAGNVGVEVSRIGDATHIEFSGQSEWKYDIKRDPQSADKIILRLQGLSPETTAKLKAHKDPLIKNLTVRENGVDGMTELVFNVSASADYFDYIGDQPSRLVVDFFPKEKSQPATAEKPKAPQKKDLKKSAEPEESSESADASDEEDEEDEETTVVQNSKLPVKKQPGKRNPAGGEFPLVARGQLPAAPSLAEQISSRKDFSHGIFDGGDPEFKRFAIKDYEIKEDAIIGSRANFYLPFPMLELGVPQLKTLISTPPTYEIVPSETRENKEARILLRLFAEKKRALLLKTADEFLKTYPKGPYDEIVRYLQADTYYELWRLDGTVEDLDTAMNQYLQLTETYPESPITPRTLLLMGYSQVDRGDSFGALRSFQRFVRSNPNSKHLDRVNIFIAEAYLKLNRFDDAYGYLDQIEKSAKTQKAKHEAAFRKGDVFFRKKDYAGAIEQYKAAINRYPAGAGQFPNAWYNIAEAEFSQGRYKDSIEAYRLFVQKFPDNEHGGYAMTRIGELLGILGADPKRAHGAFMESYFRYRATPGAGVARMRMLANRMPEMKEKELAHSIKEIRETSLKYANRPPEKSLEKSADAAKTDGAKDTKKDAPKDAPKDAKKPVDGAADLESQQVVSRDPIDDAPTRKRPELPGVEEFSALLVADGYSARKEFDTSAAELISFYQKNPQSPNRDRFKARIVRNMTEAIRVSTEKNDFIDSLRRYSKEEGAWLKNNDRVDTRYYVGQSYEQAGVFKEATQIYRETLKRLAEVKAAGQEKERGVFENLPRTDAVRLRLAAVAAKERDFARAETELKALGQGSTLTDAEQIERAEVAADVSEARGQAELARRYLTDLLKAWKGEPSLTSPLHLRMARLQILERRFKEADTHLKTVLSLHSSGGVSDDVLARALEMRGDLWVSRGNRIEAAKSYRELLDKFEDKRPLASVRYRLGQVLYDSGDFKGAEAAWTAFRPAKNPNDNLWEKLAAEQMQGAKWQNEYKKYIDRIPAATELR